MKGIKVRVWYCAGCECWLALSVREIKKKHVDCPWCVHSMKYIKEGKLYVTSYDGAE